MKKEKETDGSEQRAAESPKSTGNARHIIIAGDDGSLYHLTPETLQAHGLDSSKPAHAQAQKLVAERLIPIPERAAAVEENTGGSQSLADFLTEVGWD